MDSGLLAQAIAEFTSLQPIDLLTILTLASLEGILSVDNALVLAILVRDLPKEQQKRALTYGIVGAFAFRFIALIFATYLMRLMIFKLIGGAYLIYIAMKHMFFFSFGHEGTRNRLGPARSFWHTVFVVEMTDVAFSIDSITTAVAMSDKIIVVWAGGIMGIIFLRFVANTFVRLLERLPKLEDLAYQLIFFVGTKLTLEAFHLEMEHGIFWMMMGVIGLLGASLVYRDYRQRTSQARHFEQLLGEVERDAATVEEILNQPMIPRQVLDQLRARGIVTLHPPQDPETDHQEGK